MTRTTTLKDKNSSVSVLVLNRPNAGKGLGDSREGRWGGDEGGGGREGEGEGGREREEPLKPASTAHRPDGESQIIIAPAILTLTAAITNYADETRVRVRWMGGRGGGMGWVGTGSKASLFSMVKLV